jgi:SAM-dependent methyltransferase
MITNYDRIARFYDVDMAQNMRFDDVAYYAHQCSRAPGPVLELGCGNGRILLPLAQQGIDVAGIDASASMLADLARKAAMRRVALRAVRGDVRRLPFRAGFASVVCPYSLVTYMTSDADARAMIAGAREVLAPRGLVVIDAFVPRAVAAQPDYSLDYERPFGALTLVRRKRITPLADGANRIERRYELRRSDGRTAETVDVAETIRPRAPAELRGLVTGAGFAVVDEAWDYATRPGPDGAQFYTLVARKT